MDCFDNFKLVRKLKNLDQKSHNTIKTKIKFEYRLMDYKPAEWEPNKQHPSALFLFVKIKKTYTGNCGCVDSSEAFCGRLRNSRGCELHPRNRTQTKVPIPRAPWAWMRPNECFLEWQIFGIRSENTFPYPGGGGSPLDPANDFLQLFIVWLWAPPLWRKGASKKPTSSTWTQ